MKYINKFIALGLGIALTFAGSSFIKAEFYDVAKLNHEIDIKVKEKNTITIVADGIAYFTGKTGKVKFTSLYIPILYSGEGEFSDLKVSVSDNKYKAELIQFIDSGNRKDYIKINTADGNDFEEKGYINGIIFYKVDGKEYTVDFSVYKNDESGDPHHDTNHPGHDDGKFCQITTVKDEHVKKLIGEDLDIEQDTENNLEGNNPPQEDSGTEDREDTTTPSEPEKGEDNNNIDNPELNPEDTPEKEDGIEEEHPVQVLPEITVE